MNAKQLSENIGKQGLLTIYSQAGSMQVLVKIRDARQVFGRVDYKVEPINGTGTTWVESNRVTGVLFEIR